ncbi:MAG: GFA family protein [Caulobacteraceae bacterium]
MERPYRCSCHCGEVVFEVDADLTGLTECNCSTCRRHGFLHWKVKQWAVRLITEKRLLANYMWRGVGGHQFCPRCGTSLFRFPYPGDRISVNARSIEGIDPFTLEITRYDGRSDMPPGPLP